MKTGACAFVLACSQLLHGCHKRSLFKLWKVNFCRCFASFMISLAEVVCINKKGSIKVINRVISSHMKGTRTIWRLIILEHINFETRHMGIPVYNNSLQFIPTNKLNAQVKIYQRDSFTKTKIPLNFHLIKTRRVCNVCNSVKESICEMLHCLQEGILKYLTSDPSHLHEIVEPGA